MQTSEAVFKACFTLTHSKCIQIHLGDLVRRLDVVRYTQVSFVSFCAAT